MTAASFSAAKGDAPQFRALVILTLVAIVFQANTNVGGLLLSPARLLYLVVVPVLLVRFMAGAYGRVQTADLLVFANLTWLTLTIFMHHPVGVAITYTGSNLLLILGGYMVGRTMVQSVAEMRGAMLVLIGLVLFSLPFAILETRTSVMVLARLFDHIPGLSGSIDVNYEPRLGFNRVQFTFSHPIHYGLFCSSAFAMCFIGLRNYFGKMPRLLLSSAIAIATFLSVSSGPFLSLIAQLFLISWGFIFRKYVKRWKLLAGLSLGLYVILEILSNRPAIYVIVSKLAFAPHTANLRLLLFEYGIDQVKRAPVFGIGFHPFPLPQFMSGSIDNYWLMLCITFGLPTFLFLVSAIFTIFFRLGQIRDASPAFNDLRLAWVITMISLMLTLATVAIWTEMLSLFYFIIGAGVWMTQYKPEPSSASSAPSEADARSSRLHHSRFPTQPGPRKRDSL